MIMRWLVLTFYTLLCCTPLFGKTKAGLDQTAITDIVSVLSNQVATLTTQVASLTTQTRILDFQTIVPALSDGAVLDLVENAFILTPSATCSFVLGSTLIERYNSTASIPVYLYCRATTAALATAVFTLDYKVKTLGGDDYSAMAWTRMATVSVTIGSSTKIQRLVNAAFALDAGVVQENDYLLLRVSRLGTAIENTYAGNLLVSSVNCGIFENE